MAADPAKRPASYEDVLAAPEHQVAEVLAGELYTSPRPASPHAVATIVLGEELGPPFKRGRGGPGGWLLLFEPELHLGSDVVVPDLAGWRRERMPLAPNVAYFTLAPDWVCEVISPSTRRIDRVLKLPIYAREGVSFVWLVEPLDRTLEVYALKDGHYSLLSTHSEDERIRAVPFDAIELELGLLWADVERTPTPEP